MRIASEAPGGFVFGCTDETEEECRRKRLFGLPPRHIEAVARIAPGTPLFLYNYNARVLYGIFEARSKGGWELDPEAWGGEFPSQIRVRGVGRYPLKGECLLKNVFSQAIRENFFTPTRFSYALTRGQVAKLERLYRDAGWQPSWTAPWMRGRRDKRRDRKKKSKKTKIGRRLFGEARGKCLKPRRSSIRRESPPAPSQRRSPSVVSQKTDAMDFVMDCDVLPPLDAVPSPLKTSSTDPLLTEGRETPWMGVRESWMASADAQVIPLSLEEAGEPDVMKAHASLKGDAFVEKAAGDTPERVLDKEDETKRGKERVAENGDFVNLLHQMSNLQTEPPAGEE